MNTRGLKLALVGGASVMVLATAAFADEFNIPGGNLNAALNAYGKQTGIQLIYSEVAMKDARTKGARGDLSADAALSRILNGTGFISAQDSSGGVMIVRSPKKISETSEPVTHLADATPVRAAAAVETVVVTSSKIKGDIQTVPIAITALSQEQLTSRQIAGGPDLVKEVPNLTFTKTNFSGYSIQIRGIGTQAISVTTDPAVAVAFNDIPFIRNHFFEQEFFDVNQVEVLRGPQGTLYGRNATAGVVNVISAKPTDQFEAMASADFGNYHNRRYEGMVNIPVVGDRLAIRLAGEWTKRDGYSVNELSGQPIDGRDLWSSRMSITLKPFSNFQTDLVWEHFQENDNRLRSSKQLCKTDPTPTEVGGVPVTQLEAAGGNAIDDAAGYLSQGCSPASLYSPQAYEVPNGFSLPYVLALDDSGQINVSVDPYASTTQSRNLRVIESSFKPIYRAKSDVAEYNINYAASPTITLISQTGYGNDFLYSVEDFNRFNTSPGIFNQITNDYRTGAVSDTGVFCDPQLGCADRLAANDLSTERSWQLSQEFRLATNFKGPLNFNLGANYLHYETDENYYVFINALTLRSLISFFFNRQELEPGHPYIPNGTDNRACMSGTDYPDPLAAYQPVLDCPYIDPNPLSALNGQGHNYFRSDNPYTLNSYAYFNEANYEFSKDLKFTAGLRWTDDRKHFTRIPSEVLVEGYGYPSLGVLDQEWQELTGRFVTSWTPKLDFTDQTLVYASYSRGYKAGGANPPGAILTTRVTGNIANPVHPLTFAPEFINAYELGTKNTGLGGSVTFNASAFYYDYKGYQISEIVDRTAINLNFDATVDGGEVEASWEPLPGLRFNFAGGYENTRLAKGSQAVDLIDRTDSANHPDWMVVKPFPTQASNCVLPIYVVERAVSSGESQEPLMSVLCGEAYGAHNDPLTFNPYIPNPSGTYPGFDPVSPDATNDGAGPAPNNGAGFDKNLSGNELPNAPHFTTSLSAEYTVPVSEDWAATLHSDFYWQSQSFARVFNDRPYDKLRGYSNLNFALVLTSASGWQVMGYLKNVFNATAITGDFLNSDDTGLTTNVFLTDPRLFGVRVTKNF